MTLSNEDAKHFYKIWIPLLDFVNRKHKLIPSMYGMTSPVGLDLNNVFVITEQLWKDPSIISTYLEEKGKFLKEGDSEILENWMNNRINGNFIVDRYLTTGAILVSLETEKVYLVKGIFSPWQEMLKDLPIPQEIYTTIIPFKDCLIQDGIVRPVFKTTKKDVADKAKELYKKAKENKEIIEVI